MCDTTRGAHHEFHAASGLATAANLLLVQNIAGMRNLLAPYWSLPLEAIILTMASLARGWRRLWARRALALSAR